MFCFANELRLADLVDGSGEVKHLVGETPLVVVPGDELDEVAVEGDAGLGVEDGAVRVGAEVGDGIRLSLTKRAVLPYTGKKQDKGHCV